MNGTDLPRTDAVLSEQKVQQGLSEDISYSRLVRHAGLIITSSMH